jgi:hypothetical protein
VRWIVLTGVALACAACSQEEGPAEQVAEAAEQIVAPTPEPEPLAAGKWAPKDTCAEVEGAGPFRRQLAATIEARDADVLAALAAEDVKLDFGDGAGRAELRNRLNDESRGLWAELDTLMTLGCSANKEGGITLPWFFDQDLGVSDPFTAWLVTGEAVPVFAGPDRTAERRASVSWDMVEIAKFDPEADFQAVELADGTTGFVATDKLRSAVDYRLIASSRNGRWRIISFVAGD